MAAMAIPEKNLLKLCKEYFCSLDETDADNRPDTCINMNNITLEVESIEWHEMTQPNVTGPFSQRVNLASRAGPNPNAVGKVWTTKDSDCMLRVTINSGLIKGLNRMMNLPLSGTGVEVTNSFGHVLSIDPGKHVSEVKDNVNLSASIETNIGPRGASAYVHDDKKQYTGRFKCTVIAKGLAIRNDGREAEISTIIRELQRAGHEDLNDVRLYRKKITFPMTGELQLLWEHQHGLQWM